MLLLWLSAKFSVGVGLDGKWPEGETSVLTNAQVLTIPATWKLAITGFWEVLGAGSAPEAVPAGENGRCHRLCHESVASGAMVICRASGGAQ